VWIAEGGNLLFPLAFLAATIFLFRDEGAQSPGSEIDLHFVIVLAKGTLGEDGVSPERIPERVDHAHRRDGLVGRLYSLVTGIVPGKFYAEIVDAFSSLWRKRWDAAQVGKDGALVCRMEWLCWIRWVVVVFY